MADWNVATLTVGKGYVTRTGRSVAQLMEQFGTRALSALAQELYREGEEIMAASKPLVPVDTGALRSSGYVQPPVIDGTVVRVTLGYGGPAAKINPKTGQSTEGYAIFVHENLEAHHPVGMAKYLEIPFDAAKHGMVRRLIAGMRKRLSGGSAPGYVPPVAGIEVTEAAAIEAAIILPEG